MNKWFENEQIGGKGSTKYGWSVATTSDIIRFSMRTYVVDDNLPLIRIIVSNKLRASNKLDRARRKVGVRFYKDSIKK